MKKLLLALVLTSSPAMAFQPYQLPAPDPTPAIIIGPDGTTMIPLGPDLIITPTGPVLSF